MRSGPAIGHKSVGAEAPPTKAKSLRLAAASGSDEAGCGPQGCCGRLSWEGLQARRLALRSR
ncbi:DUF6053 domain-containing protein [Lysobacter yananisis]|uniref:DUF6053 domain-containing protein n=1 Tax=Lysobacter yananisis TaxID=1003114 RepID=UPI003CE579E2